MDRRQFLARSLLATGGLLGTGALLAPRPAWAASGERKFLFVYNLGGWDPTRVFAPEFDNPIVDMEAAAGLSMAGGLPYVAHPDRPSVSAFLEAWHDRTTLLNGVLVRGISHDLCRMISLTGSSSGLAPDWPTLIAAGATQRYVLPHLVIAGPSYPGEYGSLVARSGLNGQLDGLLSGRILETADQPISRLDTAVEDRMQAFLSARAGARQAAASAGPDLDLASAMAEAIERARELRALSEDMDFSAGEDLGLQAALATRALSLGLCRVASLSWPAGGQSGSWDSHTSNDQTQSSLFEALFAGLVELARLLEETPGTHAARLLDETTVVVWSEMGRAPQLNDAQGKDHWPYGSVMLFGAGVGGDRVVGGFDEGFAGRHVDPDSAEVVDEGEPLSAEMVGATLLAAAGLEPGAHLPGQSLLSGVLS